MPNNARAQEILTSLQREKIRWTNNVFLVLIAAQWLLGITFAAVHFGLRGAFEAAGWGALIACVPVFLLIKAGQSSITPFVTAVAQITYSAYLIYLNGDRLETHFHIFGSLAFLAFYRDVRVLLTAAFSTILIHSITGDFGHASELAAWILFESVFLVFSIRSGRDEMWTIARTQVGLERNIESVEQLADRRSKELVDTKALVVDQQQALVNAAKMSIIGEMAD